MQTIIEDKSNPPTCSICPTDMPPTIISTDNPNNNIEKVSNNNSTVKVNIINKSFTKRIIIIMIILITRFYELSMKVQLCLKVLRMLINPIPKMSTPPIGITIFK